MPITSVKDNEKNRWNRNAKKKKKKKKKKNGTRDTEAIAKGWEINDFVERLS